MPWKEVTAMKSKIEFIRFALQESHAFSEICQLYNISRKTGYKLLKRYHEKGIEGLKEHSRRPHHSPRKTSTMLEKKILAVRNKKPSWGGRKIRAWLMDKGEKAIPAASTINSILHRQGYILKDNHQPKRTTKRFEHELPNDLWQIDFKGHFGMRKGRCHPLTILDDHSRFAIGLRACADEKGNTIKPHFIDVFEEYGLPWRINFDNGSPWAARNQSRFTEFSIWLMRLGIRVSFSRPRHPQTNGKDERFHRTLKTELLRYYYFADLNEAQYYFDQWRDDYNLERPHEALNLKPPMSRYQLSHRRYPQQLPEIDYRNTDEVRHVNTIGYISYRNQKYFIGEGFKGLPVALREKTDGYYVIYFCHQSIGCINLREKQ